MIFKFIKSYFRGLGVRGIINWIFVCVIVFTGIRACKKEKEYKQRISELTEVKIKPETPAIRQAKEISREVDTVGREKVVFRLSEPLIQMITDNSKVDSIAKIAGTQSKQIAAITQINGSLEKQNTDLRRAIDILENGKTDTVFRYSDPWFSAEGFRKNDTVFTLRNITANMSVNKIDHNKKKYWLFGENQNLSTVYYESPYARVDGMQTLTIRQPEPKFKVNVNFGGKYLHTPKQVLIGPSVRLGIGRVGINGGYYINPGGSIGNTVWYGADYSIY